MIRTIIFDLGGVYFTDGTIRAVEKISAKYNLTPEAVKEVLQGELGSEYRIGKITADTFWEKAKKLWGVTVSSEELSRIWLEGYQPIEGIVDLVRRLKDADYELLFLSDNTEERVLYLSEKYNFFINFKDGIFSHLVKVRKPDPEIYKIVLEKSSSPAEACVYIDDKIELLEPAAKLGMKVILFKNPDQLESDLKKLGILLQPSTQ